MVKAEQIEHRRVGRKGSGEGGPVKKAGGYRGLKVDMMGCFDDEDEKCGP